MKVSVIEKEYEGLFDNVITVNGWVLTTRPQKEVCFIKLNDGSHPSGIQLVCTPQHIEKHNITIGCSIQATGTIVRSPSMEQPYELNVSDITVLGSCGSDYPLSKSKMTFDYLRKFAHIRSRTSSFGSIFRIKSAISHATHLFFHERNFLHINPNIITINECEGGAGVFQVTEHDITNHLALPVESSQLHSKKHDWSKDHFGRPAFLTVSSQLQLEALACSLGSVYTTNKSFRSEHSSTNKHLSEFEHLEVEDVFVSLDDLMSIGEDYIKSVGRYLLDHSGKDIDNLGKFASKGLRDRIETLVDITFTRITYSEAIDILTATPCLKTPVVFGDDLCSEFEQALVRHFNGPVFVKEWPSSIKSFYMKQIGNKLCSNFDLIMPYGVGELIGGSMREDDLDTMLSIMKEKGVSPEPLAFYTDLRKFGTVPHGGFGLGLDRMCMLFTGMESIKDVVAFPVHFKHCAY